MFDFERDSQGLLCVRERISQLPKAGEIDSEGPLAIRLPGNPADLTGEFQCLPSTPQFLFLRRERNNDSLIPIG